MLERPRQLRDHVSVAMALMDCHCGWSQTSAARVCRRLHPNPNSGYANAYLILRDPINCLPFRLDA